MPVTADSTDPTRLTDPEQRLRDARATGTAVDLRIGGEQVDDPAGGHAWGPERTIRAEVLADLLTSPPDSASDGGQARRRPLRLAGARITGRLDLEAAELICPLVLTGCWFDEPVVLTEAMAPAIRLPGCHLPGLHADQLATRGNLELNEGFTATDEVRLFGAHIGGNLDLTSTTLTNPDGRALNAVRLTVDQDLLCHEFTATGEVRLFGAHIGGNLEFAEATLTNPAGRALTADGLTVSQDLACRDGFTATGEVWLLGAHIGGQFSFTGTTLTNPDGRALTADGLTVDQSMLCSGGFTATGEMRLVDAHIGGQLILDGARLINPDGWVINADGLTVDQDLFCSDVTTTGEMRLVGAHIGGQLNFNRATLTNPGGMALNLEDVQVRVLLLHPAVAPDGLVQLALAHTGVLDDDPVTWPTMLTLHGFTYDTLDEPRPISVRQRLDWLARDHRGYAPQPYEQLAAVYRRSGREEDARRVAIAKQRRRRASGELGWPARIWSLLLGGLVGHGYRTWYAALWLAGWVLAGSLVFAAAHPQDVAAADPGKTAPAFQPVIYALDVLLPVVDLKQEAAWVVTGWARWWVWVSILAGWVLTTAVVAALTMVLKRD